MSDADILGGGFPSPPPPPPYYPQARGGSGIPGTVALSVLAVVCFAAIVVAGTQIGREMTRPPTASERARASALELASRWATWPAGRIFPATLPYSLENTGGAAATEQAQRVAIDPAGTCGRGLDASATTLATGAGCRAVLRATYLDQPQGLAVTIGVVAFPDGNSAARFRSALPYSGGVTPGLLALGTPGTVAARYTDHARQFTGWHQQGPYAVGAVVGYADGRPGAPTVETRNTFSNLVNDLALKVIDPLGRSAFADCGRKEWRC